LRSDVDTAGDEDGDPYHRKNGREAHYFVWLDPSWDQVARKRKPYKKHEGIYDNRK